MVRGLVSCLIGLGAALALAAGAAWAGQPVSLRPQVQAAGDITLGDLFDNAGPAAGVVVGTGAPPGQTAVLDAAIVRQIAADHGLDWDTQGSIQRILVVSVAAGEGGHEAQTVQVLTYVHNMMAGDQVQPQDLAYGSAPVFAVPPDAPRDAEAVIGKIARRPLRAGSPVSAHDLSAPLVVKRDDDVQVAYHSEGISLILQGKAMADGAVGDQVAVMNTTSKKVIQAVVTGPDQAVVGPEAEQMRALEHPLPVTFAALP